MTWITAFGGVISLYFFGLIIAPQPWRYIPELDMGIALLIGLVARALSRDRRLKRFLIAIVATIAVVNSALSWGTVWSMAEPSKDVTNTIEYEIAVHLESLASLGERVYATGSVAYWLNVFTNIPQVRGGSDQGATNRWWAHVKHQVNDGGDPNVSYQWLKALNVRYVVVDFPNASTAYKDYKHPFKFEGTLKKVFRWKGVAIYEIPMSNSAGIQIVSSEAAEQLTSIQGILDLEGLADYLEVVEDSAVSGVANYVIENPDEIRVTVLGCKGRESLLVKSTF